MSYILDKFDELEPEEKLAEWLEWLGPVKFSAYMIDARAEEELPEDYLKQCYKDEYILDNYEIPGRNSPSEYDIYKDKQLRRIR